MNNEKEYDVLKLFWDDQFRLSEDDKNKIIESIDIDNDWKELVPSLKQLDALKELSNCKNILDYGCGDGWASIACAKYNAKNIKAVDLSSNAINYAKFYSDVFNVSKEINFETIDDKWLKNEKDNSYDGFFSSNVLDVIPTEVAKEIIKESARITTKDATVIFSFNYYMDLSKINNPNFKIIDNYVYINDVLRLVSRTDEEWIDLFSDYYNIERLEYFAWPGEVKESRRLFYLKKK